MHTWVYSQTYAPMSEHICTITQKQVDAYEQVCMNTCICPQMNAHELYTQAHAHSNMLTYTYADVQYICIYMYKYTHISVHQPVYICTQIHIHTSSLTHSNIHVCRCTMKACKCSCTYAHINELTCRHTQACKHAYTTLT